MSTLSKKYSRERSRHFIRLKITWDIIRRTCVGRLLNRLWWWWSVTCWVPQVGKTKGNCRFSATTTTTISSIIKWSQGELLFHYLLPFRGQLLNTELLILIKNLFHIFQYYRITHSSNLHLTKGENDRQLFLWIYLSLPFINIHNLSTLWFNKCTGRVLSSDINFKVDKRPASSSLNGLHSSNE